MSEMNSIKTKINLSFIIWGIKIIMALTFLIFSFIPLISATLLFLPYFLDYFTFFVMLIGFFLFLGIITIYGIFTLQLRFRGLSTGLFSFGIIFSFNDPYLLTLGIVFSWSFYEFWFLTSCYQDLIREYSTYTEDSIEKQKLIDIFRTQVISFGLLAWIVLSISWGILFIASNYFIEVGEEFGTLGISISIAMIILLYIIQKIYKPLPQSDNY
ncbi:MAG: hypothetical protein ACFE95_09075 [Candidatus Hodarchaeota archaeon]